MIRLGIVGCNYGRAVLLPAFRTDPRCEIVALACRDAARATELAREAGVAKAHADWTALIDDKAVDAVAIATPPRLQPEIAMRALDRRKPVFVEKPMAASLSEAEAMVHRAAFAGVPAMIDFEFPELPTWQRAKVMIDENTIGRLLHVTVTWHVENYATRMRLHNWKTQRADGGGVLGNFISHCFHYLEWFCGPIAGLSARLSGLPGNPDFESTATLAITFASGASCGLVMSTASYLGSGHRVEFYGEDGTLMLTNTTADYMRGFELFTGKRPAAKLQQVEAADPTDTQYPDGRIAPVSRLVKRFIDAVENGTPAFPGFAEGLRVQSLIEAARRSHDIGCFLETAPGAMGAQA